MSGFYNPTYFQNLYDARHHSSEDNKIVTKNDKPTAIDDDENSTGSTDDTQSNGAEKRSIESHQNDFIGTDLTAAQLYESIESHIRE